MMKFSLAVLAAAALVFAGCSTEETPEEKGSTTSNISLPDLSDLPKPSPQEQIDELMRQMSEDPDPKRLEIQQQLQNEQNAMNTLKEVNDALQNAQVEAARNPGNDD